LIKKTFHALSTSTKALRLPRLLNEDELEVRVLLLEPDDDVRERVGRATVLGPERVGKRSLCAVTQGPDRSIEGGTVQVSCPGPSLREIQRVDLVCQKSAKSSSSCRHDC
jgi:hypothetical protein